MLVLLIITTHSAAAQTPDSAFAVSRAGASLFRVNVDGGVTMGGAWDGGSFSGGIPAEGAGTRLMWYPQKGAARAGYVSGTQWDDANIGYFSFAAGENVRASGDNATAFGLRTTAAQVSSFAAGEDNTASGAASVALGYHAHTNARQGSFVFSDRSSVDTLRAGVNHSANWRTSGGFRIFTSSNLSTGVTLQSGTSVSNWGQSGAVISTSTGAYLSTGGVWTNASDVNRKHLFAPVDGEDVLQKLRALPITSWSYRTDNESVRHVGPTAQDFRAAFGLGQDSVSIGTIDADGVSLIGVKALEKRTADQQARIETLERDNAALRERLDRLEKALTSKP
ncbi:MAG: hypothetical protein JWM95_4815 [Gemmatimonadetes bacterium]|nr:hypothetical protein [Gemmatimonadota bacterium]